MKSGFLRIVFWVVFGGLTHIASAMKEIKSLVNRSEWREFVAVLNVYQKMSPGAFPPVEWTPFSSLDFTALEKLVLQTAKERREILAKSNQTRQQKLELEQKLSLKTNSDLYGLMKKASALPAAENTILKSLDPASRVALTPLDELFKNTEMGQKISKDLAQRPQTEVQVVQGDPKKQELVFLGRKRSEYYNEFFEAPLTPVYKVQVQKVGNSKDEIRIRAQFLDTGEVAPPDMNYRRAFLKGSFFGSDLETRFLMGTMPKGNQVFVDETGTQHFSGDGHNH
jgi:hypothetical protein